VVDSVHGSWTSIGRGPRWTDHHGQPQSSTELARAAASGHGCPPEVAQWGEGCVGSPSRASPARGRQCGGRAMAVKKRHRRHSVRAALGHGVKIRREGRGAVEDGSLAI
jgi:hypothetical protein